MGSDGKSSAPPTRFPVSAHVDPVIMIAANEVKYVIQRHQCIASMCDISSPGSSDRHSNSCCLY